MAKPNGEWQIASATVANAKHKMANAKRGMAKVKRNYGKCQT